MLSQTGASSLAGTDSMHCRWPCSQSSASGARDLQASRASDCAPGAEPVSRRGGRTLHEPPVRLPVHAGALCGRAWACIGHAFLPASGWAEAARYAGSGRGPTGDDVQEGKGSHMMARQLQRGTSRYYASVLLMNWMCCHMARCMCSYVSTHCQCRLHEEILSFLFMWTQHFELCAHVDTTCRCDEEAWAPCITHTLQNALGTWWSARSSPALSYHTS